MIKLHSEFSLENSEFSLENSEFSLENEVLKTFLRTVWENSALSLRPLPDHVTVIQQGIWIWTNPWENSALSLRPLPDHVTVFQHGIWANPWENSALTLRPLPDHSHLVTHGCVPRLSFTVFSLSRSYLRYSLRLCRRALMERLVTRFRIQSRSPTSACPRRAFRLLSSAPHIPLPIYRSIARSQVFRSVTLVLSLFTKRDVLLDLHDLPQTSRCVYTSTPSSPTSSSLPSPLSRMKVQRCLTDVASIPAFAHFIRPCQDSDE